LDCNTLYYKGIARTKSYSIIASDGIALDTIEFPYLQTLIAFLSDNMLKGANFKWKIVQNTPKMMRAIWNEKTK
jgi:hypothetical protein